MLFAHWFGCFSSQRLAHSITPTHHRRKMLASSSHLRYQRHTQSFFKHFYLPDGAILLLGMQICKIQRQQSDIHFRLS